MNLKLAYQNILENSGKLYDPDIIKVFQRVWENGKLAVNLTM
jgi:hypothetical protein